MSTKRCPSCGSEYLATVERCADCDVELVEAPTEDGDVASGPDGPDPDVDVAVGPRGDASGDQVVYELHEWGQESRVALDGLLATEGVPHAWQGTDLLVPAPFEGRTDELIDAVDVTSGPLLDPDAPKLAYDLDDWTDEQTTGLLGSLDEQGIPYAFDVEGALVVHEADEEQVEGLIDGIDFPDALPLDGDDGEGGEDADDDDGGDYVDADPAEVLSDLFVASDRLARSARDAEGVLGIVDAAGVAAELRLPYGFDRAVWDGLVGRATALKDALEQDDTGDEELEEQAGELRDLLRQYV